MCFELIPNELLFDVFEYLSSVDLFHAFNGLNIRFDNLLIEYFQVRKSIDFRLIYKEDLNLIRQRYLPVFINEITSICLSDEDTNPNEIDLFISRLYPLHRFVNLQSITFYNIYSAEKINRILTDLQRISNLTVLNFHQCQFEYDLKRFLIIMNGIWSLSNLTHCSLDLFGGFYRDLISPTIISCSIQNLSIKGLKCGLEVLSLLYDHTPNLQNLSIEGSQSDDDYQSLPIMYLLNTLTLKCENSSRLFLPILRKVPNLTKLTIETTKIEMNGQQWENIIRKYLPNLKIFNLKMKYEVIDVENIEDQIDHILDSYRTQFWIDEHKWFVRCFSTTGNHGNSINIHTLPYRFKEISLSINDTENYIFRSTCPNNDHYLVYNYVQNLDCCCNTSEEINLSQIQFPNVEYLTLTLPYDDYFRCLVPQFDKLISLNIHMFDMGADDNQLLQLQLLLDQAPRLYYLKFETWSSVLSKAGSKNKKSSTNPSVGNMPPFALRSSSVRYLDLRGTTHVGTHQYYNDNQCLSLIRSPLGIQCEFLLIEVEKRTNIVDIVNKMKHLRTLNIRCRERKSNDDDTIKWLQRSLPLTCSFERDSRHSEDIRLWIR